MKQLNLPLKKNDRAIIDIIDINTDGNGVGRFKDYACFVPETAIGDRAEVLVLKTTKSYCYCKVLNIIENSSDRVKNDCPAYKKCGGCSLRHISYESELRLKGRFVQCNLQKIGGVNIEVGDALASPKINGYRNKALYPVRLESDKLTIGFFAKRSHRVVPCESCSLHPSFYEDILECVRTYALKNNVIPYDEESGKGMLRHIFIRHGEVSKEVMVCLVINSPSLPKLEELEKSLLSLKLERDGESFRIASICLNINNKKTNVIMGDRLINIYGDGYIRDTLCGVELSISPLSFYQINHDQTENLYAIAKELLAPKKSETIIDLYCGAGTIGLSMANEVKALIGAEIVPEAIKDAKENAKRNGITNARFICADASEASISLEKENISPDGIIVDPPRKGLARDVIETIAKMNPKRVVYVSCNSGTASRDVRIFEELGYKLTRARAVDMFPRTMHVESVMLLSRAK